MNRFIASKVTCCVPVAASPESWVCGAVGWSRGDAVEQHIEYRSAEASAPRRAVERVAERGLVDVEAGRQEIDAGALDGDVGGVGKYQLRLQHRAGGAGVIQTW
jgi:hypothetical protein